MAHFRTAYGQREIILTGSVSSECKVGDLVTVTGTVDNATVKKATSLAAATHIIAQSDMTLEYGHVPVENRDYRYVPTVAAGSKKKVAVFEIIDKMDIVLENGETA
jgi:hypothetical protein